jgi:hypothetical protein
MRLSGCALRLNKVVCNKIATITLVAQDKSLQTTPEESQLFDMAWV